MNTSPSHWGLDADGAVKRVEILEYREAYGDQVRNPTWRSQFTGKKHGARLTLTKDIQNISGATLSSRPHHRRDQEAACHLCGRHRSGLRRARRSSARRSPFAWRALPKRTRTGAIDEAFAEIALCTGDELSGERKATSAGSIARPATDCRGASGNLRSAALGAADCSSLRWSFRYHDRCPSLSDGACCPRQPLAMSRSASELARRGAGR
jgi:hypothetical protein